MRNRIEEIREQLDEMQGQGSWSISSLSINNGGSANVNFINRFFKDAEGNITYLLDVIDKADNINLAVKHVMMEGEVRSLRLWYFASLGIIALLLAVITALVI